MFIGHDVQSVLVDTCFDNHAWSLIDFFIPHTCLYGCERMVSFIGKALRLVGLEHLGGDFEKYIELVIFCYLTEFLF